MQEIKIDKIIRSRRKTIALHVLADATLVIRAPYRVSVEYLEKLVMSKRNWISKKQESFRSEAEQLKPKEFVNGELYPLLGNQIPLEIINGSKLRIWLEGKLKMSTACLSNPSGYLRRWYSIKAKEIIVPRVKILAEIHGFNYKSVRINNASGRWGSCGPKNSLNFSWRLITAPLDVIDSVILHELVHTEIKNHSAKFYSRLYCLIPDYKDKEKWLKNNSAALMI